MTNNYVMYIVVVRCYFGWLLGVLAAMSSLAQLQASSKIPRLRSRDMTVQGWPRVENPEASSYPTALQSC